MKRNIKFHSDYKQFMSVMLKNGYAERIPDKELDRHDGKVWYLPHHGIYHPKKPEKIRVVFDCGATYEGVSLNGMLLQGPDLTNSLIGVLVRFRQEEIAIMGDVEAMFHQVRVPKADCDCLRFLWWPEGDLASQPIPHRMLVHLFGAVSSPSCANAALINTAESNASDFDQKVIDTVLSDFYVDDCLSSTATVDDAVDLVKDTSSLCARGGWVSNSPAVLSSIPMEDRAKDVKTIDLDTEDLPNDWALGVYLKVQTDTMGIKVVSQSTCPTRRGILSTVSSVYDPLGFAAPFVLPAKIILQDLCRQHLDWDQEVMGNNLRKWTQWLNDIPRLESIEIDRCYKPEGFDPVSSRQIHNFSDAIEVAYGMVSYLRLLNTSGKIHCSFVMGKSRVTPLKKITIPRLELTAAALAARMNAMIVKELRVPVDQVFYWTDSMSVLRYIANETSRFSSFVANRVTLIREATNVDQWNYVESKTNPAEIASRGSTMTTFLQNDSWFKGPKFLWKTQQEWPQTEGLPKNLSADDPEVKKPVMAAVKDSSVQIRQRLLSYHSSWTKLRRNVAWILRAMDNLQQRRRERQDIRDRVAQKEANPDKQRTLVDQEIRALQAQRISKAKEGIDECLDQELIQRAERAIIRYVQRQHFSSEMNLLQSNENKDKVEKVLRSSATYKLNPFVEDGLLRVGGRLRRAEIPYDARHPIILPRSSHVSYLLLQYAHKSVGHLGRNSMLAFLREQYWVIGVIFTCLTIRAVHLEIAHSLDTESCINAIRRFVARRGPVKSMRSDNGTNLVGSEKELRDAIMSWNQTKIGKELSQKGIQWILNPPSASHFGGIWERIIRSVRKILHSLIQEQVIKISDEALLTLFSEVEAILNGRPITSVPSSPDDLEALTPNQLLLNRHGECLPPGVFDEKDNFVQRKWRQVQYLADIFWKRWIAQYLLLLQERRKWNNLRRNLQVNDLVLVVDDQPRHSWCLGRVISVEPDCKGLVRSVMLKTKSGTLRRPIRKLCVLLEADC